MAFPWLWELSRDLPLVIHSPIMAAGDSGKPVHPGSSWEVGGMLLLLIPRSRARLSYMLAVAAGLGLFAFS